MESVQQTCSVNRESSTALMSWRSLGRYGLSGCLLRDLAGTQRGARERLRVNPLLPLPGFKCHLVKMKLGPSYIPVAMENESKIDYNIETARVTC